VRGNKGVSQRLRGSEGRGNGVEFDVSRDTI